MIDQKTELLAQDWEYIKTVHDYLGSAMETIEATERNIEAVLYLEGCDPENDPPTFADPSNDTAAGQKGG